MNPVAIKKWAPVVVLLAGAVVVAVLLRAMHDRGPSLQSVQLLPSPKALEPIELQVNGMPVRLDTFKGTWALVFLGFLSCPDVCPVEMQKLGQMLKRFDASGLQKTPAVAFVSVDPERDAPEDIQQYVAYFDKRIIGVTGRNIELAKLARFLGAAYSRSATINGREYLIEAGADMPAGSGENYTVNHSSRIFVIDPQGRYVGSFAPPYDVDQLFNSMKPE